MEIYTKTKGIHPINFACSDLVRSNKFYRYIIGFFSAIENDELFVFAEVGVFTVFKNNYP